MHVHLQHNEHPCSIGPPHTRIPSKLSPAKCIRGRPIRDLIPILPGKHLPWQESLQTGEETFKNRHMASHERWNAHTRSLPSLSVGGHITTPQQTCNTTLSLFQIMRQKQCQRHHCGIKLDRLRKNTTPAHKRTILDGFRYLPTSRPSYPTTPNSLTSMTNCPSTQGNYTCYSK